MHKYRYFAIRQESSVLVTNEAQVREYVSKWDVQKSIGPDGVQPQVLRELMSL